MSQEVSADLREGGNTKTPSLRTRQYCFTINNYTEEDISQVVSLVSGSQSFIYGFEGDEKTKHIQGFVRFKNQKRFSVVKKAIPRAHIEKAKGSIQDNYKYCSKEGNFKTNIVPKISREEMTDMVLREYDNIVWRPWQQATIDFLSEIPDTRTIRWIYEPTGNVGKSYLARFLACRPGTVVSSGKGTDIFNQVNTLIESGRLPEIVICDIPRVVKEYVSYQALENLKNGFLYSGKYEGGKCLFPHPHVICFANQKPDMYKMSADRWMIYEIKEQELFLQLINNNY